MTTTITTCNDCAQKDFDLLMASREIASLKAELALKSAQLDVVTEYRDKLKVKLNEEESRKPANNEVREKIVRAFRNMNTFYGAFVVASNSDTPMPERLRMWVAQEAARYE